MDLSDPEVATSSSNQDITSRKRKCEEDVSTTTPSTLLHFKGPYRQQRWSIPEGIIYYISKNPSSPKVYQKLIKSSKYFFAVNPVIVCSKLTYIIPENTDGGNDKWKIEQNGEKKIIKLNNSSTKLWITTKLAIGLDNYTGDNDIKQNLVSSNFQNIYRCEATTLRLQNQTISFNDYKFLASNAEWIEFKSVTVQHEEDGSVVALEKLFEAAENVTDVIFNLGDNGTSVSTDTVKNLMNIPHFTTMNSVRLFNLTPSFDLDTWFTYAKKNKSTLFLLHSSLSIPEAYATHLEEIVDEIIATKNHEYIPPCLNYPGLDQEKYDKLREIYYKYFAPNTNVYVSMRIPPKRLYFTPPTRRQRWSLPELIICYMAKNPRSAKVYEKLTKSSKYFFAINPIIVCSKLTYIIPENTDEGNDKWKIEQNGELKITNLKNTLTKLWITSKLACALDDFDVDDGIFIKQNLMSSIVPNIYRCEARLLYFRRQTISFDEFKHLVTNVYRVRFLRIAVKDENGSAIAFEKLIESAPKVKFLIWLFNDDDTSVSTETDLLKNSHFSTRKCFGLFNTPATFDLDTWFLYVKKNKSTRFNIDFSPLFPGAYQNRLECIIDEINKLEFLLDYSTYQFTSSVMPLIEKTEIRFS